MLLGCSAPANGRPKEPPLTPLNPSTPFNPSRFIPGIGSQPYVICRAYGRAFAMAVGDPLAPRAAWAPVAAAFLRAFPTGKFAHVGCEFAGLLRGEFGFQVSDLGGETTLEVGRFKYGKR